MKGFDNEFLFRYLKKARVPYIKQEVEEVLLNHPSTPSMKSVGDTLDSLNIRTMAVGLETADLDELDYPVMAHLKQGHGEFILLESKDKDSVRYFRNGKSYEEPLEAFAQKWSGNTLLLEAPDSTGITRPRDYYWKKYGNLLLQGTGILLLMALMASALSIVSIGLIIQTLSLLALSLAGLGLSLHLYRLHLNNSAQNDKYCKKSKNVDCSVVLNSKWAKLFGRFNWAQVGIAYFSGQVLYVLLSTLSANALSMVYLSALTALAGMFSLYSLYLQAFVIKKWCSLCLLTQCMVLMTVAINLLYFSPAALIWNTPSAITLALSALMGLLFTLRHDKTEQQKIKLDTKAVELARFKGDADIFNHVLSKQRMVHSKSHLKGSVLIGHEAAPNEILMAASLHCGPCASMFIKLTELVKKHPESLKLKILFTMHGGATLEEVPVQSRIIHLALTEKEAKVTEAIQAWYEHLGMEDGQNIWLDKFKPSHLLSESELTSHLKTHQSWLAQTPVFKTPTLFFNNHELPPAYSDTDTLKHFL